MTSVCISEEDACYCARNLCAFSQVQKGTTGLTHKGCVLQHVSWGVLSDVTVVLEMRQKYKRIGIKEWKSLVILKKLVSSTFVV